jgi:hypothetical protein
VRLYYCKPILQLFYKEPNASIRKKKPTHRHVIACVCIIVNPSCNYFTKNQTHPSEKTNASSRHRVRLYYCKPILQIFYKEPNASIRKKATHRHVIACVCGIVNPSCKYFTKNQTHSSEKKTNASSCHRVRLYYCKPILQIFYKNTIASIRKKTNSSSCHHVRLYLC